LKSYILITPARNEEAYIEKTIQSVVAQSVLPKKWIIVSDGSVDRTDAIVGEHSKDHSFILPLRRSTQQERNFGSKAEAFRFGYEQAQNLEFDFVGNLDADVSFDSTYYEGMLTKLEENVRLGVAGGVRLDFCNGRFRKTYCARNSVGGPFQLFRRQCYETIGGYRPLKWGGIDAVAEVMARVHGWEVESFPEFSVYHHRCTGTEGRGIVRASSNAGIQDYVIGYHPLFEIARSAFRLADYPLVVGSFARLAGYCWAAIRRYEKAMPDEFVQYLRSEQLARLRSALFRTRNLPG
jgi:glycosyltransferase involved in cell wall biosynthesis